MRRRKPLHRSASLRRTPLRTRTRMNPVGRKGRERSKRIRERWAELREEHPAGVPCARCGELATDLHHRLPRSRGGTEDDLVPVDRRCHDWIESHPDQAHDEGWTLHSWEAE